MASEYNFKNKVIVITGASQGIGKTIAIEFSKQHAHVIICARTQKDLDQTKHEIEMQGGYCDAYRVDVSQYDEVHNFFNSVVKENKKIDALICCAGIYGPLGSVDINDMQQWKKTIEVNLLGTVYCVHEALISMKKNKCGKIITLCGGGVGGNNIKPNLSAYISSKGAIALFIEVIAQEVLTNNIQINAISPGAVNTRLLDEVLSSGDLVDHSFLDAAKKQKEGGGTPPQKAAELCLFLASEKSDGITGKLISAVWDPLNDLLKHQDELINSDIYTLRRITPKDHHKDRK
ncbi:MAG: hypothetical protein A3F13_04980 [Gammaproteobacteria bacterium RIFCSPHIGHO2_12_FULL_40_19]|nr:MAG: hypothetical protein A3F13_04980 [Gammaproteobacteria bacterium RIFCSPHIGHO2_12_FULL_40_19]